MSTYLELCQDLVREAGITGSIVTVSGQSGEMLRVVRWIRSAYRYILNKHPNWKFLRADVNLSLIAGTASYTASSAGLTDFGEWKLNSFRAYTTSIGVADEQPVAGTEDYDDFRDRLIIGNLRTMTGRPQYLTEKPDQSLLIWPIPDLAYTLTGEYYKSPANLTNNSDTPVFPSKFHEAIVWRALMFYGEYEGDATAHATGQTEFKRILSQMELLYLPPMVIEGTMA